ncbi:hypothetical protein Ntsu_45680 [Nocardia sp. IFM 10818]
MKVPSLSLFMSSGVTSAMERIDEKSGCVMGSTLAQAGKYEAAGSPRKGNPPRQWIGGHRSPRDSRSILTPVLSVGQAYLTKQALRTGNPRSSKAASMACPRRAPSEELVPASAGT